MAPRLRVLAGTSPDTMVSITSTVNTGKAHIISSSLFEGQIVTHIKGFTDKDGKERDSEYFQRDDRQGVTWSIQVQGRFLIPYLADDILFGNTFDRPLKLPWGTGAILKFMHYIDPTLQHDLQSSTKPWALSPLISTMPYFMHTQISRSPSPSSIPENSLLKPPSTSGRHRSKSPSLSELPAFPTTSSISDDTSQLYLASASHSGGNSDAGSDTSSLSSNSSISSSVHSRNSSTSSQSGSRGIKNAFKMVKKRRRTRGEEDMCFEDSAQRRSFFSSAKNRQALQFGPKDVITTDFCYGFINFSPSLSLQLPGGLSFDLLKYWDGQPVRFVCCERKDSTGKDDGNPWGRLFWCVTIEIVNDGED